VLARFQVEPGAQVSEDLLARAREVAKEMLTDHFAVMVPLFGVIQRTQDEATELRPFFIVSTPSGGSLISDDGEGPAEEQALKIDKEILAGTKKGKHLVVIPDERTNLVLSIDFVCQDSCKSLDLVLNFGMGEVIPATDGGRPKINGRALGYAVYRFKAVEGSEVMNLEYTSAGPVLPPTAMAEFKVSTESGRQCIEATKAIDERTPCFEAAGQDETKLDACLAKKGAEMERAECSITHMKASSALMRPVVEAAVGSAYAEKKQSNDEASYVAIRAAAKKMSEMKPRLAAEQPVPAVTGEVKPTGEEVPEATGGGDEFRDLSKERGTSAK
ncbi:MAG: hypothetical protein KDD43_16095, partial [Bdellovibrionales bacterium]|nr:hypothetical protein [Bdellovibrionales bacterium]